MSSRETRDFPRRGRPRANARRTWSKDGAAKEVGEQEQVWDRGGGWGWRSAKVSKGTQGRQRKGWRFDLAENRRAAAAETQEAEMARGQRVAAQRAAAVTVVQAWRRGLLEHRRGAAATRADAVMRL